MKDSKFKDLYAPTIVLVIIAFVITFALVFSNKATAPTIKEINAKTANEARARVLSEAGDQGFEEYNGDLNEGITEVYMAKNKCGMVITSVSKSFGGDLTAMIGIDKDGKITAVEVTEHNDTPGLGTKVDDDANYLSTYKDKTADDMTAGKIKDNPNVKYITGATVSSTGVYNAVKGALQQFEDCGGVK